MCIRDRRDAKWVELGGERLAALLDQAAAQLADMVVYDFSAEGRAAWQGKVGNKDFVRVNDVGFAGRPIRQGDDWAWVHAVSYTHLDVYKRQGCSTTTP